MRTSQKTNPDMKRKKKRESVKRQVFVKYMQERLAIAVIAITLALFALIYVLYDIVENNRDSYNQIVLTQQDYDSRPLAYRRGDIVDRNGTYLATTEKVYNLILDPRQIMSDEEDYLEASVTALSTVLGYDAGELRTLITSNPDTAYVRYARQLSYDQKEAFETYQTETNKANSKADSKARVKGVWFEEEYKRVYPYNSLASSVIGFATSDGGGGNGGIEQSYNSALIGTNGREYGYLNDDSNLERVIKPAVNGNTVVSTLDVNVQNAVEKRIQEWMTETGSDHVGVVVMNPNNGEILAMAGESPFDLNNPREVSSRYTDAEIRQLGVKEAVGDYKRKHRNTDQATITEDQVTAHYTEDEIRSLGLQVAWNQEWRNFCVSDTFEPGSPSKIFTVATALEEGIVTPNDSFYCDGYQEVGGFPIKCTAYIKGGHQNISLAESLMVSCNDAMMQIAAKTGTPLFTKYQRLFGFGTKSGIDLPGEPDTSGLLYTADTMKPVDLATSSFGQTYNCTMVQMAAGFSSVINGGSYYEPHVVRQIVNEQGAVVKKIEPKLVRETVSESTSSFIRDALYRTVSEGTGKAAAVPGYKIGGKTGTAQKLPRSARNYLLSFCGFAPVDDPQVLVYVVVDVPHVEDQPHSTYASVIFQKIMSDILPYLNIFPETDVQVDEEAAEKLPESEGITEMTGSESEEVPEESKVYDAEEYVDPGMELGLPDAESSEGGAASGPEGEASQADGGKTPAETEAESSAEDSTRAETGGEGT
ncbi:MAG: peptidoglycan D,D-transpeptidase FtsI family protein [Monoglobales bacterium]|jgi:stage V sporulation protein D (sporulation-specific penicillin-binding protein)